MSAAHTPGPWMFRPISFSPNFFVEKVDAGGDACAIGQVLNKADARLIAAAPELLEALAVIVANAGLIPDPATGESTDCYAVPIDDIEAAIAALAKARGK